MALLEFNLDGIIVSATSNLCKLLGYDSAELKGSHLSILLHRSFYKSDKFQHLWEDIRGGKVITDEFTFIKKDESELIINGIFSPVLIKSGSSYFTLKSISFDFNNIIKINKELDEFLKHDKKWFEKHMIGRTKKKKGVRR